VDYLDFFIARTPEIHSHRKKLVVDKPSKSRKNPAQKQNKPVFYQIFRHIRPSRARISLRRSQQPVFELVGKKRCN
jgi:hypothetical protein